MFTREKEHLLESLREGQDRHTLSQDEQYLLKQMEIEYEAFIKDSLLAMRNMANAQPSAGFGASAAVKTIQSVPYRTIMWLNAGLLICSSVILVLLYYALTSFDETILNIQLLKNTVLFLSCLLCLRLNKDFASSLLFACQALSSLATALTLVYCEHRSGGIFIASDNIVQCIVGSTLFCLRRRPCYTK